MRFFVALANLDVIALEGAIDAVTFRTVSALTFEHPWHRGLTNHLIVIYDLLLDNGLLRVPVPFISPEKPCNIIKASLVKRISILSIATLQILICGLISHYEVLMVPEQPKNEDP